VLDDDPYRVGAKGLKDLKVWGTVFEGEVFPVAGPSAALHRPGAVHRPPSRAHRYRQVQASCCGAAEDRCDTVHRLASWAGEAAARLR
jgi:hypothetical protein